MEDSDQEVQEIDPPVINWNGRKKYRRKILIEPLDSYFCRRSKRNEVQEPIIIDIEDDDTRNFPGLASTSTTEDIRII
jgi:hypothetical protein